MSCAALQASPSQAESYFDQIFRKGGEYALPADFSEFRAMVNRYALAQSIPPVTDDRISTGGGRIDLSHISVFPLGRSLQKSSTDFEDPRLILSLFRAVGTVDRNGGGAPVGHLHSLSHRFFVGFSPRARSLEVISWDPAQGQYRFYVAKNFPRGPRGEKAQAVESPRHECMQCHQHGGPIFPRGPWSESHDADGVLKRLCEKHPSGIYQGARFVRDCACNLVNGRLRCAPVGATGLAALFDEETTLASKLLQARSLCQTMCEGPNAQECRLAILESAIRLPRVPQAAFIPNLRKLVWRTNPKTGKDELVPGPTELEVLQTAVYSERDGHSGAAAKLDALRAVLDRTARRSWPKGNYAVPSRVLADRNPLANPVAFLNARDGDGNLVFETRSAQASSPDLLKLFELFRSVTSDGTVPPGGDPLAPRPLVDGISVERAALTAMDVAFTCLGFERIDTPKIRSCAEKHRGVEGLIASPEMQAAFKELSTTWPLAGPHGGKPSAEIQTKILKAACDQLPDPSVLPEVPKEETPSPPEPIPPPAPDGSPARAKAIFARCMECHDGFGAGTDFTLGTGVVSLEFFRAEPKLLTEAILRMRSQGRDHMPKGDFDRLQTKWDAADLEAWQRAGTP